MTKFDFVLALTLVMIVFLILDALHVPVIPMTRSVFVQGVQLVTGR